MQIKSVKDLEHIPSKIQVHIIGEMAKDKTLGLYVKDLENVKARTSNMNKAAKRMKRDARYKYIHVREKASGISGYFVYQVGHTELPCLAKTFEKDSIKLQLTDELLTT